MKKRTEIEYKDLIAFHPGCYIAEIIEDYNVSQKEFADRMGTTPKTVSKLVNGEINLSEDLAGKLSRMTGISYKLWRGLQVEYEIKKREIEEMQESDREKSICKCIDFKYFRSNGFLQNYKSRYTLSEKMKILCQELKISSLSYLLKFNSAVSYRNSKLVFSEKNIINANTLLALGENLSREVEAGALNLELLKESIPELRKMTTEKPDIFYPKLEKKLLECGIILVRLPFLANSNLNGACKKFKNQSVLLLITDKSKTTDIFWFTLFHELAHILKQDFATDLERDEYLQKEKEADDLAVELLIENSVFAKFIEEENFSKDNIVRFAEKIGVGPEIVVGRLQHNRLIGYNQFNFLKQELSF